MSLVPSATETLCAWDVEPVAVTRWCERPDLPCVGGTKDPDVAAIVALRPDLVVMCEEENRLADADELRAAGIDVHALRIRSVAEVAPQLAGLAERLGVADRWSPPEIPAAAAGTSLRRAFVPIWREPRGVGFTTISDDTYGASMLASVGVTNVFAHAAIRYPATTLEEAATMGADLVVAPSEPYPFGPRHRAELSRIGPVVFVDGQDLFWWGVRTAAARARLAACLAEAG